MKLISMALTIIACLAPPAWAVAAPEISVDRPTYDFGSISQGKKVEHAFVIRNRGNVPLAIKSIRPSCGCTAIASSLSVIPPGKSGEIKASFNSANYSGAVQKTIAVESNDPKTPASILTIKGTIVEDIQLAPKQLNLGQVQAGVTRKTTITVTNKAKKPLGLIAAKSTLQQVTVTIEKKLLKPGESGTLLVSTTPRKGDRLLSGYLSITTDSPVKPEISVPVYGSTQN